MNNNLASNYDSLIAMLPSDGILPKTDAPLYFEHQISLYDLPNLNIGRNYEYAGFDFKRVLMTIADASASPAEAMSDVWHLICLYVQRGTNTNENKLQRTMDDSHYNNIRTILNKYKIGSSRPTSSGGVSLGRLAATFPHLVVKAMRVFGREVAGDVNLPIEFQFPSAPSLFTPGMDAKYKDDFIEWSLKFDKIINTRSSGDKSRTARLPRIEEYYKLSSKSKVLTAAQKVIICRLMGYDENGNKVANIHDSWNVLKERYDNNTLTDDFARTAMADIATKAKVTVTNPTNLRARGALVGEVQKKIREESMMALMNAVNREDALAAVERAGYNAESDQKNMLLQMVNLKFPAPPR